MTLFHPPNSDTCSRHPLHHLPCPMCLPQNNYARRLLVDALNAIVPFEQQDPDEQFYPARCGSGKHHWHENANHEGDTCNCGEWYRFADRIETSR